MATTAVITVARLARVREEGVIALVLDVPDEEGRGGEAVDDWIAEEAVSRILSGQVDVEWHEVDSWDHETFTVGMELHDEPSIPISPEMFPCPTCGTPPIGTVDTLVCRWGCDQDGHVAGWDGNDLNTQSTLYQDNLPVLVCHGGHQYTHPGFTDQIMQSLHIERGG